MRWQRWRRAPGVMAVGMSVVRWRSLSSPNALTSPVLLGTILLAEASMRTAIPRLWRNPSALLVTMVVVWHCQFLRKQ
jgi:hypothetical protein